MVLVACSGAVGQDTEFMLELGADILKYRGVQEERGVFKRVYDRCECGAKGRCDRVRCCDCCCAFVGSQDGCRSRWQIPPPFMDQFHLSRSIRA